MSGLRDYLNFIQQNGRFLFYGFLLAFLSSSGQTYFIALFGAEIRQEYALSHGDFGLVFSLGTLASAACLIWAGRKVDNFDLRLYSVIVIMGLAVACGLMAGGEGIVFLCLALFGLRLCGQGLLGHTSQTAMARYFDAGRGKALSIASQGHAIAQALFPSLVVLMVGYVGWRSAWGWYGLILVLVMAPVVLILLRGHGDRHDALVTRLAAAEENSRSSDSGSSSAVRQWTLREVLRHPTFYLVMTNVVAPGMLMTGLMFHQIHILEVKNWDIAWFAFCFVAYSGFSVLTGIAVGPMIDRYSAKRLITSYLAPMGLGILALVVSDHPAAVLVWFVLSGATSGMHRSVVSAYWAEAYGVRHLGAIRSLVSSVSVVGTAISPVLFGWMIDDGASVELIATICVVWIALAIPSTCFGLRYSVNT